MVCDGVRKTANNPLAPNRSSRSNSRSILYKSEKRKKGTSKTEVFLFSALCTNERLVFCAFGECFRRSEVFYLREILVTEGHRGLGSLLSRGRNAQKAVNAAGTAARIKQTSEPLCVYDSPPARSHRITRLYAHSPQEGSSSLTAVDTAFFGDQNMSFIHYTTF